MDIDIDLKTDFKVKENFENVTYASINEKGVLKKHVVGTYFQNIPIDEITELSAIPYDKAENIGYKKIDFLSLSLLNDYDSKKTIRKLTKKEPDWELLEDEDIVSKLFHISKHYELVNKVKPKSVNELADILALIRPSKQKLIDKYLENRNDKKLLEELYTKRVPSDMRKSHAISYALNIVLQLHAIK